MNYLRTLVRVSLGKLLGCTAMLTREDRDMVVGEFEACKAALMEVMESKLAHWMHLPYSVCALGATTSHGASEDVARECLRSCVAEYSGMTEEQRAGMWPTAVRLCDAASPLRGDVLAFLDGQDLRELPALERVAASMQCIPIVERSIEAKHRYNKLNSCRAPRAGGAF
eukprot:9478810-Pyramimonas_sp.AAC.1